MGEVWFYHLTRRSPAETLHTLLPRCLSAGWRIAVRSPDAKRLRALDDALWLGPSDAFLPHGLAGGAHDAAQPILLTTGVASNGATVLMALDGAEAPPEEVRGLTRTCVIFDGLDGEALTRARKQWKELVAAGLPARYWSEESGKWEQKATKNVSEE
ncbi:DNA polymerase III subunit chi [Jannaschia seohaensis]|uniref:DNA polymerase III chi subunit n=1 Tax=Jannaschia seohaensis TaxID=475081 RepID=A0A2Y9BXU8_9RHOB|nr:DNA polymerase III subunit chi [Jannaschia seohaensis]PWJ21052.1 DNA polymerase III chi subunit [Jannaschia seohaensis]SSA41462.1 DNA polymerase III, chi subunit [Jannaschia seohaensis]